MIHVRFVTPDGAVTGVDSRTGQSLMRAALDAGIDGIAADCGGMLSCGTCHVHVREPHLALLPAPLEEERSMLAFTATAARPDSRLACQIELTQDCDGLTVDLPASQY